jgi:hypothetical protein
MMPAWAQLNCTVNGYFPKSWEGKQAMLVVSPLNHKRLIDTTTIHNRSATFTAKVAEPCPAYVWVEGNKEDIQLFIDSPQIQLALDPDAAVPVLISGSFETELWQEQKSQLSELTESSSELHMQAFDAFRAGDSLAGLRYKKLADSMQALQGKMLIQQIERNPTSGLSWYMFVENYSEFRYTLACSLFSRLASFSMSPSYKTIREVLLRRRPGRKASDFSLLSLTGDTVRLSKTDNRLILIDFASITLNTCRERHKALKKLYETYHPLGLEIITICFEYSKQAWQENMINDPLPWHQLVCLPDSFASIMVPFAVERMPDSMLLDADKIIIERDLSITELDTKLKQLLNKR